MKLIQQSSEQSSIKAWSFAHFFYMFAWWGVCMFNILMKLGTFYLKCIWIERCHVCWIYILIEFCTRVSKTLRCKQQTNTTRLSAIERISVKLFTTITSENEEKKKRSYIFCLYHPHSHFDDLAESTCSPWLLIVRWSKLFPFRILLNKLQTFEPLMNKCRKGNVFLYLVLKIRIS